MPSTHAGLNDRLRQQRTRLGISQTALAARLGVKQNVISNWETGRNRIPIERLAQLADVYGTTIDELVREEAEEEEVTQA